MSAFVRRLQPGFVELLHAPYQTWSEHPACSGVRRPHPATIGIYGRHSRWHDNRHTFITDLAEGGEAADETIRDMAGHVSNQMLKHYSHIRMQAKRRAVESLVTKAPAKAVTATDSVEAPQNPHKWNRPN